MPNEYGGRENLDAVAFLKELNEVAHAPRAGHHHRGGGVHRLAGRLAPDLPRRPRLRLQVEHGLDARHARVLPAGPGLPPLAPPRADVLAGLRVHGELHPAAVARRGRARQGLADQQDAGRPVAEAAPTCARCTRTCGRTPARSCCSWARSSPRRPSGTTSARSTGTCSSSRSTPASSRWSATSTTVPRRARAVGDGLRPHGFWWIEANDAEDNVVAFAAPREDSERVLVFVANFSPVPRHGYRIGLPRSGRWVEAFNTDSTYYGGSDVGNLGGVEAEPAAGTASRSPRRSRCRRSARSGSCPRKPAPRASGRRRVTVSADAGTWAPPSRAMTAHAVAAARRGAWATRERVPASELAPSRRRSRAADEDPAAGGVAPLQRGAPVRGPRRAARGRGSRTLGATARRGRRPTRTCARSPTAAGLTTTGVVRVTACAGGVAPKHRAPRRRGSGRSASAAAAPALAGTGADTGRPAARSRPGCLSAARPGHPPEHPRPASPRRRAAAEAPAIRRSAPGRCRKSGWGSLAGCRPRWSPSRGVVALYGPQAARRSLNAHARRPAEHRAAGVRDP